MTYGCAGLSDEDLIECIIDYAVNNPGFDIEFVESVNLHLYEHGSITKAQRKALENIVNGFTIDY